MTTDELQKMKEMMQSPDLDTISLVHHLLERMDDKLQIRELYESIKGLEYKSLERSYGFTSCTPEIKEEDKELRNALEALMLDIVIEMAYDK